MTVDRAPIHKGCKQEALESPVLWHVLLDEAFGPPMPEWQRKGSGVYLGAFAAGPDGRLELAYADDLLLAKSKQEQVQIHPALRAACAQ